MGPNIDYIEGYPSSIEPWQRDMIRKTGMHIHCWSFNTQEQYMEYCGPWQDSAGQGGPEFNAVDGGFTNRTDLALRFYKETLQGYADQGRATTSARTRMSACLTTSTRPRPCASRKTCSRS